MSKLAIITDSNSGITQSRGKELGIYVFPMPFFIDGELFLEDITLTQEEFYKKLGENSDISTSQPSPGDVMELWEKVLKEYDEIVHIPMSSGLSSSCSTASITPASTAAVNAALDIMESEPERIEHLWKVTNYALDGFRNIGCEIGHTSTPIIPLFIRDNNKTFAVTRDLLDEGIFVNPVVSPAVPSQDTLIRFSLMATHTIEQVDIALDKIGKVFRKYDIIK